MKSAILWGGTNMQQVRIARDITSFDVEIDSLTEESLHERYLRLMREFSDEVDDADASTAEPNNE